MNMDTTQCFPISDHVSFPRVSFLCLTVAHEKTHEYGYTLNKESYSQGIDTWSEMGKHCHAADYVYFVAKDCVLVSNEKQEALVATVSERVLIG